MATRWDEYVEAQKVLREMRALQQDAYLKEYAIASRYWWAAQATRMFIIAGLVAALVPLTTTFRAFVIGSLVTVLDKITTISFPIMSLTLLMIAGFVEAHIARML